jgi:hypothetical protein
MITSFVVVLLALGQRDERPNVSDEPSEKTAGAQLVPSIIEGRYRRVGVLPRFIVRSGTSETLGGPIGPEAELLAEELQDDLVKNARGRFEVVDGRRIATAFRDLTLDDLGRPEALLKAAGRAGGLDALVVGSVVDQRATKTQLDVRCRLVDLKGSVVGSAAKPTSVDLSTAAYMGESWELRRWTDAGLINVGLNEKTEFPFLSGSYGELISYGMVLPNRPYPLEVSACPFTMSVLVNGKPRPRVAVGNQHYVALDPGETYEILIENRAPRGATLSLFVDGINILGKKRENPAKSRFWTMTPRGRFLFRGWLTPAGGQYRQEAFEIAPADDSVAAGQGFSQALGMITAVFSTIGMDGVPEPPRIRTLGASITGSFGTGAGAESKVELKETRGPEPGVMLAAITLRYATTPQLKRLQQPKE